MKWCNKDNLEPSHSAIVEFQTARTAKFVVGVLRKRLSQLNFRYFSLKYHGKISKVTKRVTKKTIMSRQNQWGINSPVRVNGKPNANIKYIIMNKIDQINFTLTSSFFSKTSSFTTLNKFVTRTSIPIIYPCSSPSQTSKCCEPPNS